MNIIMVTKRTYFHCGKCLDTDHGFTYLHVPRYDYLQIMDVNLPRSGYWSFTNDNDRSTCRYTWLYTYTSLWLQFIAVYTYLVVVTDHELYIYLVVITEHEWIPILCWLQIIAIYLPRCGYRWQYCDTLSGRPGFYTHNKEVHGHQGTL